MAEIDLVFDPDNFVAGPITDPNPFFPLVQGNEWVYQEVEGLIVTERVTGETKNILSRAKRVSPEHPVVFSKFETHAREIEIDAVADGGEVVLWAISEHIENAGVHSGDATLVLPPQTLYLTTIRRTREIAQALKAHAIVVVRRDFNDPPVYLRQPPPAVSADHEVSQTAGADPGSLAQKGAPDSVLVFGLDTITGTDA